MYLTAYVHLGFFGIGSINFCHPSYCGFLQQSQDTNLPPKPKSKNDLPMRRVTFLLTFKIRPRRKMNEHRIKFWKVTTWLQGMLLMASIRVKSKNTGLSQEKFSAAS